MNQLNVFQVIQVYLEIWEQNPRIHLWHRGYSS